MFYLVTIPRILRWFMPHRVWEMPRTEKKIYLSFDDGPHPQITQWVLDELKKYDAKATFFCLGKNVELFPETYSRILNEGHRVGNHGYAHLNASCTDDREFMEDVEKASRLIESNLFRPPYGRINRFKLKLLNSKKFAFTTIMWTVLSGDFDQRISGEQCLNNVLLNTGNGSIIVFHDSEKAEERLRYTLPLVLKHLFEKGYHFEAIP